ncbi:hypothetical protein [Streptomyces odonnellii]|uniref:hypothetical protein n=1 Tax=Streptomyces odonnellii TaxID=1417980 RepID=UPI0012FEEFEF|nr:hypothetical protein [Streptomyces odonnellii]
MLCAENGYDLEECLHEAMVIHDRVVTLSERLKTALLAEDLTFYQPYLYGAERYLRGCLDWIYETRRYRSQGDRQDTYVPRGHRDKPYTDRTGSVPLTTISWWWNHAPS